MKKLKIESFFGSYEIYNSKLSKSFFLKNSKNVFYLVDKNNSKYDIEDQIEAGDIGLFYASLRHGLDTIAPEKTPDINKKNGRWWFGLNVHNSDEMAAKDRKTTIPYNTVKKNNIS